MSLSLYTKNEIKMKSIFTIYKTLVSFPNTYQIRSNFSVQDTKCMNSVLDYTIEKNVDRFFISLYKNSSFQKEYIKVSISSPLYFDSLHGCNNSIKTKLYNINKPSFLYMFSNKDANILIQPDLFYFFDDGQVFEFKASEFDLDEYFTMCLRLPIFMDIFTYDEIMKIHQFIKLSSSSYSISGAKIKDSEWLNKLLIITNNILEFNINLVDILD